MRPKVAVERLLYLLGFAADPTGWRMDNDVSLAEADDLVPAIAGVFAAIAHRVLRQGVLQGYRVVEESLAVVRGRLLHAEQLRQRPGLAVPLSVRYDDFTLDIAENQLLRAAAVRLLRAPGVPQPTRARLHRLVAALGNVTALVAGQSLPAVRFTRLNERYRPAVRLAELVLHGRSIEANVGGVRATGFVFDMNRVFEDYLTAGLRVALPAFGGDVRTQHRDVLDEAARVQIRPDITWWRAGQCVAVVDAKYKATTAGLPNADLYQMLAYCTVLGLPRGHLVYAAGNELPAEHVVRCAGTVIVVHALQLDLPVHGLVAGMRELAAAIASGADLSVAA